MLIYHIYIEWEIGVSKVQLSVNKKKANKKTFMLAVNFHRMTSFSFLFPRWRRSIFSFEDSFEVAHATC